MNFISEKTPAVIKAIVFIAILGFGDVYAGEIIYPPQKINCNGTYCDGVDQKTFKIVQQDAKGKFVFDYAYAVPAPQNGYVIVYVYRDSDSSHFANALESWAKSGFSAVPYYPGSNWGGKPNSNGTVHCKGSYAQCGFSYVSNIKS